MVQFILYVQCQFQPKDIWLNYNGDNIWELKGYWEDKVPPVDKKESFRLEKIGNILKIQGEEIFSSIQAPNNSEICDITLIFEGKSHVPNKIVAKKLNLQEGYFEKKFVI